MIELKTPAIVMRFVPRDPNVWDSVDSNESLAKIYCRFASLTSEQKIRSGMNASDRMGHVWYRWKRSINTGDKLQIDGALWHVTYSDDTGGNEELKYCMVRAAP